ncbi:hypothetical protein RMN57_35275 [Kitasatospora sp. CM 4170]|uniref:Uncharacterized protein n=1 Tax=Kitasatospora aburaviensis TaxID=67265 RepID=A0ABW1EUA8_9ACTN|nr:hypothetical protein [Kitasatospora sp. CM 4170]WNM49587.1 hypothetical protein RMN57_35275 [Kitasatospora sp. CM 4170]
MHFRQLELKPRVRLTTEPVGTEPGTLHFESWSAACNEGGFGPASANSALLVVAASTVTVVVAGPAAYVPGRRPGRLSNGLSLYFVLGLGAGASNTALQVASGGPDGGRGSTAQCDGFLSRAPRSRHGAVSATSAPGILAAP